MMYLDQYYSIITDENNFQLSYRREKEVEKNGENKTVTESQDYFYPTLQGCLRRYLQLSLKPCESIEEVLQEIETVNQTIKSLKC